jgi:hypothetical protein
METEILINNTRIDLTENLPISLNFSIADIKEPEKRNTSYSKTINIPGSKTNNILFSHIFKVEADINNTSTTNFNPDFNPNLKAQCFVYQKRTLVFKGYARLLRITILDKYRINYEVSLFGDTANMFISLGDAKVSDLDFSEHNHTYNTTNIRASWTAQQGIGYYYPMIDYALNNLTNWNVKDFKPAIYVKEVIDKMFAYAGFTYSSTFFDTSFFKSLILPFNSEALTLSDATIINRSATAYRATDRTWTFTQSGSNNTGGNVEFDLESADPSNQYNTTLYEFTAANIGNYGIEFDMDINLIYTPASDAYLMPISIADITFTFLKINTLNQPTYLGSINMAGGNPYIFSGGTFIQTNTNTGIFSDTFKTPGVNLAVGEKLKVQYSHQLVMTYGNAFFYQSTPSGGVGVNGSIAFNLKSTSEIRYKPVDINVYEDGTVDMNKCLPTDVKQKDVFVSIIRMFNLYVDLDKEISNRLLIEPRNDFYTSDYVDWTSKLDISQPFVISPMGALDARTYIYKYDDDADYYNDTYKKIYEKNYGYREVTIENDFLKEKKETKLIFAPTPSVGQSWNDRVLPTIVKVDNNGNKVQKSSKLRILQRGGLKGCTPNWNFISVNGTTSESQYPYSGHLDDPYLSTIDINYGVPAEIFWTGDIYYTNNNLYNKYHKKFIEEITDKNSKIVNAKFYLNPNDISELDFRKKVFINGIYYRLNSIKDYNPIYKSTTEVELIKIKEGTPFVATSGVVTGGYGEALDANENLPLLRLNVSDSNNNGNVVIGTNYVHATARNVIVSGYDNVVGAYSDMINILSSSGVVVSSGLSNVSVINTSGVTITQSNVQYINGVNMGTFNNGTYTPVAQIGSNLSSILTSGTIYSRVGDVVNVNGFVVVNADTPTDPVIFYLTLPISSSFTGSGDLIGTCTSLSEYGRVIADVSSDRALVQYICVTSTGGNYIYFDFNYTIK